MSEPRSAFSAYKANNSFKVTGSKKTAAKKSSATGAASCPFQKQNSAASTSKGKTAAAASKISETKAAKKSTAAASKSAPKTKTATATTKATAATATKSSSSKNVVAGKAAAKSNKLGAHNLDAWVEELYNSKKKLTKEQEKRKKELDAYMAKQLNTTPSTMDEDENEESDDNSEGSHFNGEYTMNSYYEDDDDESDNGEEEEWSDISGEEEETVTDVDSNEEETDDAAARASTAQIKTSSTSSSSQATKRKINEDANNNNNNKTKNAPEIVQKKVKQETEQNAAATRKRQSLAATTTANNNTAASSSNNNKNSNTRRTIDGSSGISSNTKQSTVVVSNIKNEPQSPTNIVKQNSIEEGKRMFAWLLDPVKPDDFFKKNWENSACYIKRDCAEYFQSLISFKAIDEMLINNYIEFTTHIDITSYKNGVRETLNPEGRAMPPTVWSQYADGCSIRLLNPHAYMPALYKLNVILQEYFHCLVGANAYLTPPNSQGFAPHYDDIEAFVLQIEGRKRWKLYKPLQKSEELPRVSSHNFKPDEIGKPIFEKVLLPGDVLYFPRGTIHQACTEPGHHSLHITLSVYQKQAYADLFEKLMPIMLQRAIKSHIDLRRGLPLNTFQNLGVAYSETDSEERAKLLKHIKTLVTKQMTPSEDAIDAAVDQLAKKYQHEALPPELHLAERARTVYGSRTTTDAKGECQCDYELTLETNVRLLRANILRLVREEDGKINVYYHVDNAKEYCKYDPFYMEIEASEAGTIEMLMRSYPAYVGISQFPLKKNDRKLDVATALWERGLLMTEKPFK